MLVRATWFIAVFVLTIAASLPSHAQELSGQWCGGWKSCGSSHKGRLSAQFCRIDDCHVQARFRGTFAKIIPFRYRAVLDVVHEEPGLIQLSGSKKLPLMGDFKYDATISGDQFNATYSSRRENGIWYLSRQ